MPARHLDFWAKTPTDTAQPGGPAFKPVAHHLIDVGAVALEFLLANPARLRREARLTGQSPEEHAKLCAWFAALHDLGKISIRHQRLAPLLYPRYILGNPPGSDPKDLRHWHLTAVLLRCAAVAPHLGFSANDDRMAAIIGAIAGHHGVPVANELSHARSTHASGARFANTIGPVCAAIAGELVADLHPIFTPPNFDLGNLSVGPFTFTLNGLITLADWVGSDDGFFPFEPVEMPLDAYLDLARERARAALAAKGLVPAAPRVSVHAASFTPGFVPRPMQAAAEDVPLFAGPNLVIIEDGTGSGKTEAALLLSSRMMRAGLGEGVYLALPTMATANAMEARMRAFMHVLFNDLGDRPASLVLAHGKAALTRGLEWLTAQSVAQQGETDGVGDRLNEWFRDSRKKTFFADAGVGTVDQALIGVLKRKHAALRQYALAGRILIIDEAHAYDAFTGTELEVLVESHAAHGGSVIVLTATLTLEKRQAFAQAFRRGVCGPDVPAGPELQAQAYPLLTVVGRDDVAERPVEAVIRRTVEVVRLEDRAAAIRLLLDGAARGAACAAVCNAVDEALAMHAALLDAGHPAEKLTLFHARMMMGDRLAVETEVLRRFGKDSTSAERNGQILVATQVVEQSLDIDFDVVVSDLAPADLLIQRAGRLHRHSREHRPNGAPVLHVISPDPQADVKAGWLRDTLGKAGFIYAEDINWRTADALFAAGSIDTPGGLRPLIGKAYPASGAGAALPQGMVRTEQATLGEQGAHRTLAQLNTITPSAGYDGVGANPLDSDDLGTRLGEPSVTIRLARRGADGTLRLWAEDRAGGDPALAAALSELSVRAFWFCGKADDNKSFMPPKGAELGELAALKAAWPEWEMDIALYEVLDDGHLAFADSSGEAFRYSAARGLEKILP